MLHTYDKITLNTRYTLKFTIHTVKALIFANCNFRINKDISDFEDENFANFILI